jgi:hypothetical protein
MHGEFRENNGGRAFPLSLSGVSGALPGRTSDDEIGRRSEIVVRQGLRGVRATLCP